MSIKGYCDFRCWYANGKTCRCICNGLNHALGTRVHDKDPVFNDMMRDPNYAKYGFNSRQYDQHKAKMIREGRFDGESESNEVRAGSA